MNEHTETADHREQHKTRWDKVSDDLVDEQEQIFELDVDVEFALASGAVAEVVRDLGGPHRTLAGGQQIHQNLEAAAREPPHDLKEIIAVDDKKAAHGIGNVAMTDQAADS